ncbi:MAG: CBS domain-containing protein [Nitrososphaerales archaeon]
MSRDEHITSPVMVKDIMNSPVITASPNDNVKTIAERMSKSGVGSVVVVEDGKPVGVVSDGDIVSRAVAKDSMPSKVLAKDIMQPLQVIDSEASILEAARLLRKYKVKRLGVMYKNQLTGIVSTSDVIAVTPELVDVVSEKASIMKGEFGRKPSLVSGYCDECNQWSDYLQYVDGSFICEECRGEVPSREQR